MTVRRYCDHCGDEVLAGAWLTLGLVDDPDNSRDGEVIKQWDVCDVCADKVCAFIEDGHPRKLRAAAAALSSSSAPRT